MRTGNDFFEKVLAYVKPGMKVLDLGTGPGEPAKELLKKGCTVTGIDKRPLPEPIPGLQFIETEIVTYVESLAPSVKFDLILAKNSFQFIKPQNLQKKIFPALPKHLNPGGIIAIQTFAKNPVPPFNNPISSFWNAEDIVGALKGVDILHAETYETQAKNMKGGENLFTLTDIIARLK